MHTRHGQRLEHRAHTWAWVVKLLVMHPSKLERLGIPEGVYECEFVDKFGRESGGENGGCLGEVR